MEDNNNNNNINNPQNKPNILSALIKHPKYNSDWYAQKYIELIDEIAKGDTNVISLANKLNVTRRWIYTKINSKDNPEFCHDLIDRQEGYKLLKISKAKEALLEKDPKGYLERMEPKENPSQKIENKIDGKLNISADDLTNKIQDIIKKKKIK
jgi:hypothetical protein